MSVRRVMVRAVGVLLWHLAPVPVDRHGKPTVMREPAMASIDHVGKAA